ncbi:hypothetical protein ABH925_001161 [Streptacidiphilus sp. EB129]
MILPPLLLAAIATVVLAVTAVILHHTNKPRRPR